MAREGMGTKLGPRPEDLDPNDSTPGWFQRLRKERERGKDKDKNQKEENEE